MTPAKSIKLGIFVLLALVFLLAALYFMGSMRNLFGDSFRLKAGFNNVDGLQPGNNVRLMGIDVGTVEEINILNDTTIEVTMLIDENVHAYIKKDAEASIGTEGLMGSRLVNLTASKGTSQEMIADNDVISSVRPVSTDEILRTLDYTSKNTATMSFELSQLVQNISHGPGLINSLIKDPALAADLKETIKNLEKTSSRSIELAKDINTLVDNVQGGKGALGALIADTANSRMLNEAFANINNVSNTLSQSSHDLQEILEKIKTDEGSFSMLMSDTAVADDLKRAIESTQKGAENFNETMEALQHSIFLRGYFKKKERKARKAKE